MKDVKRLLPGAIISILLIAAILYFVDLRAMVNAIRHANYPLLGLGVLLGFVWIAIRAIVWRTLLRDRPSYADVFWTVGEGYLLNNFLPFRLGEIGRAFLLSRKSDMQFMEILPTIVIERAMDLGYSAIILLAALPFVVGAGGSGANWHHCRHYCPDRFRNTLFAGSLQSVGFGSLSWIKRTLANITAHWREFPRSVFHRSRRFERRLVIHSISLLDDSELGNCDCFLYPTHPRVLSRCPGRLGYVRPRYWRVWQRHPCFAGSDRHLGRRVRRSHHIAGGSGYRIHGTGGRVNRPFLYLSLTAA